MYKKITDNEKIENDLLPLRKYIKNYTNMENEMDDDKKLYKFSLHYKYKELLN